MLKNLPGKFPEILVFNLLFLKFNWFVYDG